MPMNEPSQTEYEKELLRARMLRKRTMLPLPQRDAWDARIAKQLTALPEFLDRDTVMLCYASQGGEADTWRTLRFAWMTGKRVAMPRCQRDGHMQFYLVRSEDELRPGCMEIPEPVSRCPLYIPQPDDLCVTPALAFDREGYRLGYGGGYYDRYLARHPMRTVGICYPGFILDKLPRESFDIPVAQVIC